MTEKEIEGLKQVIEAQWLSGIQLRCVSEEMPKCWLHIYFYETLEKPDESTSAYRLLDESRHQNIGKAYTIRFDRSEYAFADRLKDHIHIYRKGSALTAVNRDGTAHDKAHGTTIPGDVANYIRDKYPDFKIPSNNYLESTDPDDER